MTLRESLNRMQRAKEAQPRVRAEIGARLAALRKARASPQECAPWNGRGAH